MLLRRITEHVKAQNWTAIALDFVIVVTGVYLGLQVQEWSVERDRQRSEGQYLTRLHSEVVQLIEDRRIYDASRPERAALLLDIVDALQSGDGRGSLSARHCLIISASTYTTVPPAELPTAMEMLSAGRLEQIVSSEVRLAVLEFSQQVARATHLIDVIDARMSDLVVKHPDKIKAGVTIDESFLDGVEENNDCDFQSMRTDPHFMNDLTMNAYRYQGYVKRGILPVSAKLGALHAVLDDALSFRHEENL
ncbi:hypothetical protein [Hyphococcus sp.]|uniref:hypothetical protein n=1 Tax=Hyphococcus sp. TaxID=2038636 RepID=UPI002089E6C4|nr:MAG: hypothetical protein DHS20C04_10070 [Marinicaulis sp.]